MKTMGMKNPLHPQPQRHVVPKKAQPPPPPKADDFFQEMGLAAKPKFGAPATTTASTTATGRSGLGATALPMDDYDLGGGDEWDDDGDLDDLLDD